MFQTVLLGVYCRFPRGYDYSLQREDYESLSISLQNPYVYGKFFTKHGDVFVDHFI